MSLVDILYLSGQLSPACSQHDLGPSSAKAKWTREFRSIYAPRGRRYRGTRRVYHGQLGPKPRADQRCSQQRVQRRKKWLAAVDRRDHSCLANRVSRLNVMVMTLHRVVLRDSIQRNSCGLLCRGGGLSHHQFKLKLPRMSYVASTGPLRLGRKQSRATVPILSSECARAAHPTIGVGTRFVKPAGASVGAPQCLRKLSQLISAKNTFHRRRTTSLAWPDPGHSRRAQRQSGSVQC